MSFLEPRAPPSIHWKSIDPKVIKKFNFVSEPERVKVYLRVKPLAEGKNGELFVIKDKSSMVMYAPLQANGMLKEKTQGVVYSFTKIFGPQCGQLDIFRETTLSFVCDLFIGRSSLVFTYGTTSSGKSFTVQGTQKNPGLIPWTLALIFRRVGNSLEPKPECYCPIGANTVLRLSAGEARQLESAKQEMIVSIGAHSKFFNSSDHSTVMESLNDEAYTIIEAESSFSKIEDQFVYSIWVSFLEIYNEQMVDLLQEIGGVHPQLRLISQNKASYVKGLRYINVQTSSEAFAVFLYGLNNLRVSSTVFNKYSSRSHSIFTIKLVKRREQGRVTEISSFTLCDLAGAERSVKVDLPGVTLKETQNINTSHLVLNRCFKIIRENQRSKEKKHVPFRDSKLTQLLQRALTGIDKMAMIVNISQSPELLRETQVVLKSSAVALKIESMYRPPEKRKSRFMAGYRRNRSETVTSPPCLFAAVSEESVQDLKDTIKLLRIELGQKEIELNQMERKLRSEFSKAYSKIIDDMKIQHKKSMAAAVERTKESIMLSFYISAGSKRPRLSNDTLGDDTINEMNKDLMDENNCLKNELASKETTIAELIEESSKLRATISDLKFECSKAKEDRNLMRRQYDGLIEGLESGDEKIAIKALQDTLNQRESKIKKDTELLEFAHEEFNAMTHKIIDLEVEIQTNEEQIANKDLEIDWLKSTIAELEHAITIKDNLLQSKNSARSQQEESDQFLSEDQATGPHVKEVIEEESLGELALLFGEWKDVEENEQILEVPALIIEEKEEGGENITDMLKQLELECGHPSSAHQSKVDQSNNMEANELDNELKARVSSLESEIGELKIQLSEKCQEADDWKNKYKASCDENSSKIEMYERKTRELEEKVQEMIESMSPKQEVIALQDENSNLKCRLKILQSNIKMLETAREPVQHRMRSLSSSDCRHGDDDDDDDMFVAPKAKTVVKTKTQRRRRPDVPSYTCGEDEKDKQEEVEVERKSRRAGRRLFTQDTSKDEKLLDVTLGTFQSSPSTSVRQLRSSSRRK